MHRAAAVPVWTADVRQPKDSLRRCPPTKRSPVEAGADKAELCMCVHSLSSVHAIVSTHLRGEIFFDSFLLRIYFIVEYCFCSTSK